MRTHKEGDPLARKFDPTPGEYRASDMVFSVVNETLPLMRSGLSTATARRTAEIVLEYTTLAAVSITDTRKVLCFVGLGSDHHSSSGPIPMDFARRALEQGEIHVVGDLGGDCVASGCPLRSAMAAPLVVGGRIIGCIKFYRTEVDGLFDARVRLGAGLARMLGTQMELAELDKQREMTATAKLHALQAQISPHFLFNVLNTIAALCCSEPEVARRLLTRFADFMRLNMSTTKDFITLEDELHYVDTYLSLEQARFGERLRVITEVDRSVVDVQVPALILQPLVENAVKHGITSRNGGGVLTISARKEGGYARISVKDDGIGIDKKVLSRLNLWRVDECGDQHVGLLNVRDRLASLYGGECSLKVTRLPERGTEASFCVPIGNRRASLKKNLKGGYLCSELS